MSVEEDHTQAGLGLLQANENLLLVFDGEVSRPAPDPPYVVVYTRVAWPKDGIGTAMDAVQKTVTVTMTTHAVGLTAVAARVVAMQVRVSLLNARPVIDGRNCSPIKQTASEDPHFDDTTGKDIFDALATYEWSSTG